MTLEASGTRPDAYASFDQTAERIEKRLRRYKRRLKEHSAAAAARANGRQRPYSVFESPTDEAIVRGRRVSTPSWSPRPRSRCSALSVSDAVIQLDLTGRRWSFSSTLAPGA